MEDTPLTIGEETALAALAGPPRGLAATSS